MRNDLVVYLGKVGDKVVYVGQGVPTRPAHLNSGVSACYLANKPHFKGRSAEIEIVAEGLCKPEAVKLESELIRELQPVWNRMPGVGARATSTLSKECLTELHNYINRAFRKYPASYNQYKELILHVMRNCDTNGTLEDTQINITNKTSGKVIKGFLYAMASLPEGSKKGQEISKFIKVECISKAKYRMQLSYQMMAKTGKANS